MKIPLAMSENPAASSRSTVIVLLGAPNEPDGTLSTVARERCDQAVFEHRRNPDLRILPTGGFGEHFNVSDKPHGHYTSKYLVGAGVPAELLLPIAESSNTYEDAELARPILTAAGAERVILVTSDFHGRRARLIFERALSPLEVVLSCARTDLPGSELQRLQAHEERAIARLA